MEVRGEEPCEEIKCREEGCQEETGSISGCKFLDENHDGIREAGIEGVGIKLAGGCDPLYRTTGPDGLYSFDGLRPGLYEVSVVQDTVPEGHYHTNPPCRLAFLLPCCMNRAENFGNGACEEKESLEEKGSISGRKWEDKDCNGDYSFPDRPIAGVEIQLWQGGQMVDSRITGDDACDVGSYCFGEVKPGAYEVKEAAPTGYFPTNPKDGEWALELKPGEHRACVNFLNARSLSITGAKYEWKDDSGDGKMQPEEKYPLEGVSIQLSSSLSPAVAETVTGEDGKYAFKGLKPGVYAIKEALTQGWYPVDTRDGARVVELLCGSDLSGMDFINARHCSISGTKWEWIDYNANGRIDGGESRPAKDIEIKLLQGGKEALPSTRTDGLGGYSFRGLESGAFTVEEVLTEGWEAINPASGTREVILKSGFSAEKVDFLNSRVSLVAGETVTPPSDPEIQSALEGTLPRTGMNHLPLVLGAMLLLLMGLTFLALGIARSRSA